MVGGQGILDGGGGVGPRPPRSLSLSHVTDTADFVLDSCDNDGYRQGTYLPPHEPC